MWGESFYERVLAAWGSDGFVPRVRIEIFVHSYYYRGCVWRGQVGGGVFNAKIRLFLCG